MRANLGRLRTLAALWAVARLQTDFGQDSASVRADVGAAAAGVVDFRVAEGALI